MIGWKKVSDNPYEAPIKEIMVNMDFVLYVLLGEHNVDGEIEKQWFVSMMFKGENQTKEFGPYTEEQARRVYRSLFENGVEKGKLN